MNYNITVSLDWIEEERENIKNERWGLKGIWIVNENKFRKRGWNRKTEHETGSGWDTARKKETKRKDGRKNTKSLKIGEQKLLRLNSIDVTLLDSYKQGDGWSEWEQTIAEQKAAQLNKLNKW